MYYKYVLSSGYCLASNLLTSFNVNFVAIYYFLVIAINFNGYLLV